MTPPPPLSQACSLLKRKYMETCRGKEEAQGQILPPLPNTGHCHSSEEEGIAGKKIASLPRQLLSSQGARELLFQCEEDIYEYSVSRWEFGSLSRVRDDLDFAWLHVPNSLLQNRGCVLLPSCVAEKEKT